MLKTPKQWQPRGASYVPQTSPMPKKLKKKVEQQIHEHIERPRAEREREERH